MNKILVLVIILFNINLTAQLKVGSNKATISSNTYFEIESTSGSKVVVRKDTAMMGINNTNPKNKLEITHGTSGNSGLRFTNLTNTSLAVNPISVNQKFLSLNNLGDVVLSNSVDQVISVSGLSSNLVSPVSATTFQTGTFEGNYSKIDSTVLYLNQTDGTTWIYTASNGGQYKSYVAPASTAWFLSSGTNDAGSNKTNSIYRTGSIGIGTTSPTNNIDVVGGISIRNVAAAAGTNYGMEINTNSNAPRIDWVANGSYIGQFASNNTDFLLKNSLNNLGNFRFYTTVSGSGTERMTILNNGNIGVGTSNPQTLLDVSPSSGGASITVGTIGTASTDQVTVNFGTRYDRTSGVGSATNLGWQIGGRGNAWPSPQANVFHASYWNGSSWLQAMTIQPTGNVGVGTTAPSSRLEVNGSATNTTAFNAAAGTTIDFSRSNLAYTTANAGAFTLTNIKDGGTYTLAVRGTTSATASFTSTGFTFKSVNNAATIAGKETLYTFLVMGTTVYVYMTTGF